MLAMNIILSRDDINDTNLEIGFVSWPMMRYKREILFGWVDLLGKLYNKQTILCRLWCTFFIIDKFSLFIMLIVNIYLSGACIYINGGHKGGHKIMFIAVVKSNH